MNKKFTKEQIDFIVQALYDGDRNVDILEKFEKQFDRKISDQVVGGYRKKHQDELMDLEQEAIKYSKQVGYTKISNRIRFLEKIIRKIAEEWDKDEEYTKKHSQLITDLQKAIVMLQSHLGENITDTTITSSGGTQIQIKMIDIPVLGEDDPIAD